MQNFPKGAFSSSRKDISIELSNSSQVHDQGSAIYLHPSWCGLLVGKSGKKNDHVGVSLARPPRWLGPGGQVAWGQDNGHRAEPAREQHHGGCLFPSRSYLYAVVAMSRMSPSDRCTACHVNPMTSVRTLCGRSRGLWRKESAPSPGRHGSRLVLLLVGHPEQQVQGIRPDAPREHGAVRNRHHRELLCAHRSGAQQRIRVRCYLPGHVRRPGPSKLRLPHCAAIIFEST